MAETGNWSPYYITDAGRALRQYSIAEGKEIAFNRAAIGTGRPADPSTIDGMSGLVAFAKDVIIKRSYAIEANHLSIIRVDNTGYTQDVLLTEMGVYARTSDQEDNQAILYGYAYALDGYVLIPAQTSVTNRKIYEVTLDTYLSRSTDIQIVFDSSSLFVSHADLDDAVDALGDIITGLQAGDIATLAVPGATNVEQALAAHEANKVNVTNPKFTGSASISGGGTRSIRITDTVDNDNYGVLIGKDGTQAYFLLTNQNDAQGNFNGYRPFIINLSTGIVTLGPGATVPTPPLGQSNHQIVNTQYVRTVTNMMGASFLVNPSGNNYVDITLPQPVSAQAVVAVNGDGNTYPGYVRAVTQSTGSNVIRVHLSELRTGNIRINVMYVPNPPAP